MKLADALGVSITTLLDHEQGAQVRIVPPEQAVRMWSTSTGSSTTLLVGSERDGPLELWSWRLMPGDESASDSHLDGTTELLHVTAGELTLVVDREAHAVRAGTSAAFEANVPHAYRNEGDEVVEVLMAVSVPPVR